MQSLLVLVPAVSHIHVEVGHIGQNHRITVIGQTVGHVAARTHSAPGVHTCHTGCHHGVKLRLVIQSHFLPALDADLAGSEQLADALDVVLAHLVLGLEALALHECLHVGTLAPCTIRHLVTAQVDDFELEAGFLIHLLQLGYHAVDEAVNVIAGHIEHVVVIALGRGVNALVLVIPQAELLGRGVVLGAVFHRHDGGTGMAGRLNLGDDAHTA